MPRVSTWTRWFAWHPVKLQFAGYVWLRFVEYEEFKFATAPLMLGGVTTVRHYRLVKGD